MGTIDKNVLNQYMDACALIRETEEEIEKLNRKRKIIAQDSVSGSNPDFPYNAQHFKIHGPAFGYEDDRELRRKEKILKDRKKEAVRLKEEVEEWLNALPQRMQRIIRFKHFDGMTWQQVARKMGKKATEQSVKKEYQRFMKKNKVCPECPTCPD